MTRWLQPLSKTYVFQFFFLLVWLWLSSCGESILCINNISNLTIETQQRSCLRQCECNNQAFEGSCINEKCVSKKRGECTHRGEAQPCLLPETAECRLGVRVCMDDGLNSLVWGDCKPDAAFLQGGICQSNPCQAQGQTLCSGQCVDLTNNNKHCGKCNQACHEDESCLNKQCKPQWARATQTQDQGITNIRDLAYSPDGTLVVIGSLLSTMHLGSKYIERPKGHSGWRAFVAKLSRLGKTQWLMLLDKDNSNELIRLAISRQGDIYITGSFTKSIQIGTVNLKTTQSRSPFVLKLTPQGKALWGVTAQTEGVGTGLALSKQGFLAWSGTYKNQWLMGNMKLNSQAQPDTKGNLGTNGFLTLFNPQKIAQWSVSLPSKDTSTFTQISLDSQNNIYATGSFQGSLYTGASTFQGKGKSDAFVAKYTPQGSLEWLRIIGGPDADSGQGITLDHNQNVYVSGSFSTRISLGSKTLTSVGQQDAFVTKLDPKGQYQWSHSFGGGKTDASSDLTIDTKNNLHVYGTYWRTITFGKQQIQALRSSDAFLVTFSLLGEVQRLRSLGGEYADFGSSIASSPQGEVAVGGKFTNSIKFGQKTIGGPGQVEGFIAIANW